jgi:hypothetical protein
MCYNCGCGLPNDPMGKKRVTDGGPSLTEEDIEKMAKGWNMTKKQTKEELLRMLQKHINE